MLLKDKSKSDYNRERIKTKVEIPDEPDESDRVNGFSEGSDAGFIDPSICMPGGDIY